VWTKTAEAILDSLARFCARISGAGHLGGGLEQVSAKRLVVDPIPGMALDVS
jgi:hypothetical protein